MKVAIAIFALLASATVQAQTVQKPPTWWRSLTAEQRATCAAQGGCAVVTVAQVAQIVIEEAAKLAAEHQDKICRKGAVL